MWKKLLVFTAGFIVFMLLVLAGLLVYVDVNQQKIVNQVKEELRKNIIGELTIDKISLTVLKEFPNLSLSIVHPVVKDSVYRKEVFSAGYIFCRLSLLQLLRMKIDARSMVIEDGRFILLEDSTGYSNSNIFRISKQPKSTESPDINFELEYLRLENLKVVFDDERRNRHFSLVAVALTGNVEQTDTSFKIPLDGKVHIDSMLFKPDKGSFMVNMDANVALNLEFDVNRLRLNVNPSNVYAYGQKFEMRGAFDFKKKPAYLTLYVTNPATNFSDARKVLSKQILEKMEGIEVGDPVAVNIFIRGDVDPDFPPMVDANFKVHNARIKVYGVNMTEVNIDGMFMNHVRPEVINEDSNSAILFDVKSAKVEGIPIKANVSVTDLSKLYLELALTAQPGLVSFNKFLPPNNYRFTDGNASVDVVYKGSLHYYLGEKAGSEYDDTLSGKISVSNGSFVYDTRNIHLGKIAADITLDLNNIKIHNLSAALNGNDLFLKGNITSVRRVFAVTGQQMQGRFTLDVPKFDLAKVLVYKKVENVAKPASDTGHVKLISQAIDEVTDRFNAILSLNSNLVTYRKFAAKNVKGELSLSTKGLLLKNFRLEACKGTLQVDGGLNTASKTDKLSATIKLKNVDMKDFLTSGENFNQTAIMDSNISGKLNLDVNFYSPLDSSYKPIMDSMQARAYFSLLNGRITNFEPLTNISKYIFKKRDFTNVSFAEIHDTLVLKNGKLFIKRMEISSSVLRIFMMGRYAFNGITDIAVQFPLNNLKKQDINYTPENIGTDARVGANIMLRVHGENNKTKITLDAGAMKRLQKEMEVQ